MSAVRDGQEVDPQDSGRIIYRFRQTVGGVSFFSSSPDIIITRPQAWLSSVWPLISGAYAFLPDSHCGWSSGKQVQIVLPLLMSQHQLQQVNLTLCSDWLAGRSGQGPESGRRKSLWTKQRLSSPRWEPQTHWGHTNNGKKTQNMRTYKHENMRTCKTYKHVQHENTKKCRTCRT